MRRFFLISASLALVVLVAVAVVKGTKVYSVLRGLSKVRVEGHGSAGEISLVSSDSKGDRWRLESRFSKVSGNVLELEDVKLVYIPSRGERVEISGDKGTYFRDKRMGLLKGNVVVKGRGWVVKGGELVWYERDRRACITGPFVFRGRYKVWGRDLCFFPSEERVVVERLDKVVMR